MGGVTGEEENSLDSDTQLAALLRDWICDEQKVERGGKHSSSAKIPLKEYYSGNGDDPGEFPFTRGRSERGYHEELWVMGMYSGYSSPKETNLRFKKLLESGQTGLSIALDLPTQIGLDSDHSDAMTEVGKVGVPINSVDDMLLLLEGLPIEQIRQIRTSANAIGPIFAAFMLVALEELGIDPGRFRLFLQNDPLKEFSARGTWIFPPEQSLKFAVDVVEYFSEHLPNWEPIQFCGYHIRDAGGTAVQEVAYSAANGIAYLDEAKRRGVDIAKIAPSLFLFLSSGVDIFEEAAKFRAARRLWAKLLHKRYGVPKERASIRIFAYTLGGALTAREPQNNISRIAFEALAAVLGGVQTLATSSWDEAHSLPSSEAAHLSLRTQQILAYEAGVTKSVDPLGGSYYVEHLTDALENEITRELLKVVEQGGAIAGIVKGFIRDALSRSAFEYEKEIMSGERVIVGVNFKSRPDDAPPPGKFEIEPTGLGDVMASLNATRKNRDAGKVSAALKDLKLTATRGTNTIPSLIAAARARATLGELTGTLGLIYGHYESSIEYGEPVPRQGSTSMEGRLNAG